MKLKTKNTFRKRANKQKLKIKRIRTEFKIPKTKRNKLLF